MILLRRIALLATLAAPALAAPGMAAAATFGTNPLAISLDPALGAPNGPSGDPAVSGDNRSTRYAAFDSAATNIVAGDTNGQPDVFVWSRPGGRAGLALTSQTGGLRRVSVTSAGRQANGASTNPSLDGSTRRRPHCVAFQSTASNLTPDDRDATPDVFVRDLAARRTVLVSRGIGAAATNPSIDGACQRVAFQASGRVYVAGVRRGRPQRLGAGAEPDVSLDGSAIVWVRGGRVVLRRAGRTSVVGPGAHPTVSDDDSGRWAVTFDTRARLSRRDRNPGSDVYMRVLRAAGGPRRTDLISAPRRGAGSLGGDSHNGGLTAYAATRGIVVFVNDRGSTSDLYYRNNRTGNVDLLARATTAGPILGVATSARANFVAFASQNSFVGPTGGQRAVFFKQLIDGEAI